MSDELTLESILKLEEYAMSLRIKPYNILVDGEVKKCYLSMDGHFVSATDQNVYKIVDGIVEKLTKND